MIWKRFREIVEERMKEQGIPLDVRIRLIDVLGPHANEEDRIAVDADDDGLSVTNI